LGAAIQDGTSTSNYTYVGKTTYSNQWSNRTNIRCECRGRYTVTVTCSRWVLVVEQNNNCCSFKIKALITDVEVEELAEVNSIK
jgi:hypothetical protein